jgi:hypothetical protein
MPPMTAASPAQSSAASLAHLLDAHASAREIESYLDSLPAQQRVAEVLRITGRGVGRLYKAVAAGTPPSLEELIPAGHKGTVIYEGRNSLPAFTRFQKRFIRLQDDRVIGYNHNDPLVTRVTGPGYFWVRPATGEGEHANELVFDYTEAPPTEPAGWPAYKPNEQGLSKFVYGHMKDYVRRVARGVVVGKAYRNGAPQSAYFSLSLPESAA